ncbi:Imm26 family immunity protein [Paraferrimonas sedimenticola]|nr:Imm26 family immunity protein [Paraferrimonas sedimenticola]
MAKNFEQGKVVEIELANGLFTYGVVVSNPLIAFSGSFYQSPQVVSESLFGNIGFQIWVMKYALGSKGWPKVGSIDISKLDLAEPEFYKFDQIAKSFSIVKSGVEVQATREDCLNLECAAVWDKTHVEDRLIALSEDRSCKWSMSLLANSRA